MRVQSSGVVPGLVMPEPWAAHNLLMPYPRDLQGWQMPRSSPGGRGLGAAGID